MLLVTDILEVGCFQFREAQQIQYWAQYIPCTAYIMVWVLTVNLAEIPAPFSTFTPPKPAFSSEATPAGLSATLFSPEKVSFGTPAS